MAEKDQMRWVGIRPTDPSETIPVEEQSPLSEIAIKPTSPPETIPVEEQSPLTSIRVKPASPRETIPIQPYKDFGTQIAKDYWANNSTGIIHTVTSGKSLYLCSVSLSFYNTSAGYGNMFVRDTSDNVQYRLLEIRRQANDGISVPLTFNPPLVLPAGWDICVYSGASDVLVRGFIFGYEV